MPGDLAPAPASMGEANLQHLDRIAERQHPRPLTPPASRSSLSGRVARAALRNALLVLLVAAGTITLIRYAPGYFADAREMDAQHAGTARDALDTRTAADATAGKMAFTLAEAWLHGSLGDSRQYEVPVTELIRPRLLVTAGLVARGMLSGFLLAFALAVVLSARRSSQGEPLFVIFSALLLAVPMGALATLFLLANTGGPSLALALLIGARDFKFLYRLLRQASRSPHLLQARAQGLSSFHIFRVHLLAGIWPELLALGTMSFILALSSVVPAEVIFDVPGLGQLAWNAAMNRDMPVLLAVTLLMASAVGVSGTLSTFAGRGSRSPELA